MLRTIGIWIFGLVGAGIAGAIPSTALIQAEAYDGQFFASAAEVPSQPSTQGVRNVYQRSRDVRIYVLARAKGKCEGCGSPAPFLRGDGTPYLEPHHLRRVSNGGPDHPAHVIALCPNCHRRVHAGADGPGYNNTLIEAMLRIEPHVLDRTG